MKYTDEQLVEAVKNSISIGEVIKKLGLNVAGSSYRNMHAQISRLELDTSHFLGQRHGKTKVNKYKLEDVLVENSLCPGSTVKKMLLRTNTLKNECSLCGLSMWLGKPIVCHLDHINGIRNDHRIENLRLLCPNCHSQTETYGGRNNKKQNWVNTKR